MTNLLPKGYSTPRREAWVAKLLSGTTKKAKSTLKDSEGGLCCLGVELSLSYPNNCQYNPVTKHFEWFDSGKNHEDWHALGLHSRYGHFRFVSGVEYNMLTELNDLTDMTHVEIGQFIVDHADKVFKPEE